MGKRLLILTAGMGAGHDAVAGELERRVAPHGVEVTVVDVLDLVPLRLGRALRRAYAGAIRSAPWLYAAVYRAFFVSGRPGPLRPPPPSPLTALIAARLERRVRELPPDAVVSTFHVAAQAAGRLRRTGGLDAPSLVLVTDFAVHRMWLHPGNDRYLCPDQAAARAVTAATGRPATMCAPLVPPELRVPDVEAGRERLRRAVGAGPDERVVLISAGAWGVGRVVEAAGVLAASGRYRPAVLCGRNGGLRRRILGTGLAPALGWRDDVPQLMAGAYALVDNAAGMMCREAFACGLPVISYRPIPGHGRDGARAMARAGLSVHAHSPAELVEALDRLADGALRRTRAARVDALFSAEPAERAVCTALG
ncbi:diacylglycerol glucosyltransferase [Actinomadura verrucosospora]|uniref:Diacylglycerol glucosyltransferase n=2 Tax=Actinomadura verrucosospora TaxID=46165 RepID=A0A7D3VV23_ACTVE|nr:diacylglycerol glucosyltransferase [Actinomadura verrucosospora]